MAAAARRFERPGWVVEIEPNDASIRKIVSIKNSVQLELNCGSSGSCAGFASRSWLQADG